jgi:hypothetical protein
VKQVRRVRRSYSPEPIRTARYSKTRIVEERRPSNYLIPPPDSIPLPPPPPSYSAGPPPDPPAPPPWPSNAYHSSTKIETKHISQPTSVRQSATVVETERPESRHTSHAPSVRSPTQASYVEVTQPPESSSSSSSSSSGDVRSQSTRRTSNTHKSATTRKSSVSKSTAPVSKYSEHEKEFRRERTYSSGRPRDEYQTYQYVPAPPDFGRRNDYDDRRASRGSYGNRSSRLLIEDERHVRQREYRR